MRGSTAELPLDKKKPVTAEDLRALLRRKYPANQFALLYEVRDAAGFGASRSADAVIVGLWPSRGCQVEGIEIKVYRNDWLRELARPEKADAFIGYCDRWWVCAGNDSVVQSSELPPTWGLMVPRGRGLTIVKDAPKLTPEPIDRSFLAAMLKRATGATLNDPEIQAAMAAAVKAAEEAARHVSSYKVKSAGERVTRLERAIAEFKEASGVEIDSYNSGDIGRAVALVMRGEHMHVERRLTELLGQARRIVSRIEELVPVAQVSASQEPAA